MQTELTMLQKVKQSQVLIKKSRKYRLYQGLELIQTPVIQTRRLMNHNEVVSGESTLFSVVGRKVAKQNLAAHDSSECRQFKDTFK